MKKSEVIATVRRDKEKYDNQSHFLDRIKYLVDMNVTMFRINIAKFDEKSFCMACDDIMKAREVSQNKEIKIILDLPVPGKKARIISKEMKNIEVNKGDQLHVFSKRCSELKDLREFEISVDGVGEKLEIGEKLIYGDGSKIFEVTDIIDKDHVIIMAMDKGVIEHGKAINFAKSLEFDKDFFEAMDLNLNKIKPEYMALSFVETVEQIEMIREKIANDSCKIMSKIETGKAVENIEQIVKHSDAIMLGRGDLGLYMDLNYFAKAQNKVIEECNNQNKEVYIATDVLSSMNNNKWPSRADIMDLYYIQNSSATGVVLNYGLIRSEQIGDVLKLINNLYV